MKRIGLLSDTHGYVDNRWAEVFSECDEIWHAGDIGSGTVIEALSKHHPIRAVYGNIDGLDIRNTFPEFHHFMMEGVRVLILHIAGPIGKYSPRLHQIIREQGAIDLLVCGHSHLLKVQKDPRYGWLYMNPGAAGIHGFHKMKTCLRFSLHEGSISALEVVEMGSRGKL